MFSLKAFYGFTQLLQLMTRNYETTSYGNTTKILRAVLF